MMETLEEIVREIRSGLPRDAYGEQVKYLLEKINAYSAHPEGREIERLCSQWIAELLPQDKREAVSEQLRLELSAVRAKLDQARK